MLPKRKGIIDHIIDGTSAKIKIGIGCVITSYSLFCGLNTYLRIQNSLYDKIYI